MPCPRGVFISLNFEIYKEGIIYNAMNLAKNRYRRMLNEQSNAGNCSYCEERESKCPQKINISKLLNQIGQVLSDND